MGSRKLAMIISSVGLMGLVSGAVAIAADPPSSTLKYRAYAPGVTRADDPTPTPTPEPTPTPRPVPYAGPVRSLFLGSARLGSASPVETRDTQRKGGAEVFQDPSAPQKIAWYPRFGQPGYPANNSIFAAHIDYVNYGKGPFAYLTSSAVGDALYVEMDNGTQYTYTVTSVAVVNLNDLDMDAIVFPGLDSYTERITLISCGGTFVPFPGGGGEYNSRVILTADRYVE